MLKLLAFGIAAGAGVQAWRQWPPNGPVLMQSAVLVSVVAVVAAYLAGLWHGRRRGSATATATATASAEAAAASHSSAAVQVFNVMPGQGAHPVGVSMPTESAPWVTGHARPEITVDDLDGFDLSDLGQPEYLDGPGR